MKITDKIFWKIRELTKKVKTELFKKGMAIPSKTEEGNVRVGHYVVRRQINGFYTVQATNGEIIVENLNLPQSAVLIANNLMLKKNIDKNILNKDIEYGYAHFEYQQYKRAEEKIKNDPYDYDVRLYKFEHSGEKAEDCKAEILYHYDKLNKIA